MGNGRFFWSDPCDPVRYGSVTQEEVIRILLNDRQRLCSVAYVVVTDFPKAEDLFQDLVVKAVQRIEQFNDEEHLHRWGTAAIRNAAIDQVRQSKTRSQILSALAYEKLEARQAHIDEGLLANERRDALQVCVDRLSEKERQLLHRRYERGESGEELAQALGISVDAIYKRLSRLHRDLRLAVQKELSSAERGGAVS